jgi:hypothetical protein
VLDHGRLKSRDVRVQNILDLVHLCSDSCGGDSNSETVLQIRNDILNGFLCLCYGTFNASSLGFTLNFILSMYILDQRYSHSIYYSV